MTLYEFLKYHEGETIKIRRISWEQDVYILCAIDGFIEHAVKTSQGKEFSYPWMPWTEDAIARAYMCKISTSVYTRCPLHYSVETEKCPLNGVWCSDVTPQDWEKVLNER